MKMRYLLATVALCFGFAFTPAAHAKKLGIINTGDELFEVGDFPADIAAADAPPKDMKVGYKCSHFGVFWADVWTWDCGLVGLRAAEENTFYALPSELTSKLSADPAYAFSKTKRGLWNHYGFWAALALFLGFAAFGALTGSKDKSSSEASPA